MPVTVIDTIVPKNNGTFPVVNAINVGGVAPVFNVKDFGAKGDGIHDDASSIQDAVNAASVVGGSVYVPPGSYLLNSGINCIAGGYGINIFGLDKERTYLRINGTNTTDGLAWNPASQYAVGGGLSNITITSNSYTSSRNLVVVNNMAYFKMSNVQIIGASNYGLLTNGGLQNIFEDSLLTNSASDACYIGFSSPSGALGTTTRFRNVYFRANGGRGVNIQYSQIDVQFDHCVFESNGWNQSITTTLVGTNILPSSTVNVASTAGWPSSGSFYIPTIPQAIASYTGLTPTSFTGCVGSNSGWSSVYPNSAPDGTQVSFIDTAVGQGIYATGGVITLNAPYFENNASYHSWFGDSSLSGNTSFLWDATVTVNNPFYNVGAFTNYQQDAVFFDGYTRGSNHIGGYFYGGTLGGVYVARVHPNAQVAFESFPTEYYDFGVLTSLSLPRTPDGYAVQQLPVNNGLIRGQQFSFTVDLFSPVTPPDGYIHQDGYAFQVYDVPFHNGINTNQYSQPVIGDIVTVGYAADTFPVLPLPAGIMLQGDIIRPWTSTASPAQVRITAYNFTGSTITLPYGTLRIDILKHTTTVNN